MKRDWLKKIQKEVKEWTDYNFPNQKPYQPLLGMLEELGELSHALLKGEQMIRGSRAENLEKEKDAIGDFVVFSLNYCNCMEWDATNLSSRYFPRRFEDRSLHSLIFTLNSYLSTLQAAHREAETSGLNPRTFASRYLDYMYDCLEEYCSHRMWDLQKIVEETWQLVKRRDWRRNENNTPAQ